MSTESVTKSKRGGKREGAGRKPLSGYGTVVMRVPSCLKKYILSMIDIYVDWMNNDEMKKIYKGAHHCRRAVAGYKHHRTSCPA